MNKNTIKLIGDITTALNPIGCSILTVFIDIKTFLSFAVIYGLGTLIVQIIKGICDSDRPREGGEYQIIKIHGYSHNDGESCCSSHAISAALPAYFVLLWINFWWFIPFFIVSCICSWSRVRVKAHWLFDVILANIIAFVLNVCIKYLVIII